MPLLYLILLPATVVHGAAAGTGEGRLVPPRLSGAVALDGDLSEPAWREALEVDGFVEITPADNAPPPVRTVARLAYTPASLYVAFRCDDPRPAEILAPLVERDKVFSDQDFVQFDLDTAGDGRSSTIFRVNPRGIQGDATYDESTGRDDFSPDFAFEAAARITADGWAAEFRIPLSSLRYDASRPQAWRITLFRNYPRDFRHQMASNRIPRGSNCWLCHSRRLEGMTGLESGGHFSVTPYTALAGDDQPERSRFSKGLDARWHPASRLTVEATVTPDFSQLEADVTQLAVNNRFALDYPEKRPFFMEGVDLLTTPIPAVYTRSITSPAWGLRATGGGGSSAFTVFLAEDRGGGSVILPGPESSDLADQDFRSLVAVARLRRSFGAWVGGFLVTGREIQGGGHNRVFGPDLRWRPSDVDHVTGQLLFSRTQTPDRPDLAAEWDGGRSSSRAAHLTWGHTTRGLAWTLTYEDFGRGFRADDGFVPQVGQRRGHASLSYSVYPKGWLNLLQVAVTGDHAARQSGGLLSRSAYPSLSFQGKWNTLATIEYHAAERVRIGDRMLESSFLTFSIQTTPGRRLPEIGLGGQLGQDPDVQGARVGSGGSLSFRAGVRPTDHLQLELNGVRQWLDVTVSGGFRERLFTAQVARVKATYAFSARAALRLVGEYERISRKASLFAAPTDPRGGFLNGSLLFAYRLDWRSVLFAGCEDRRTVSPAGRLVGPGPQLFVKVSYAIQR